MIIFYIALIISFSYFVQSAFGFGAGIIAIPLLTLFIDAKDAITIVMIFSFLCGLLVIKLWKDVDWPSIRRLMPGLTVGLVIGLALFSFIDQRFLGIFLAFYIISYVAIDYFKPKEVLDLSGRIPVGMQSFISGFLGGVIQGVMGTGGPMLVTYLKSHTNTVNQFRASVIGIFFIANLMRVIVMGSESLIPHRIVESSLAALPFFGIAMYLGCKLPDKFNQKTFHAIINFLLLLSATSVLIKQFS
ncbi:sulfite exporter TauE/SafE family protein [Telmatospirillum sp.]|uniref:sulfite exporter TauE/SafE family protein n=1 Tax=Telmatospirillum sp. TaxID=2079197 RepID=UPI00284BCA3C|nr:sulfite exporter TauE/SafE family protein [Telmatospirillum sp.]MDR3439496.1 sulfite exporter TauE/SafE family protein [Telmatospirillum sp.]